MRKTPNTVVEAEPALRGRRTFLAGAGIIAAGSLAACTSKSEPASAAGTSGGGLLAKIKKEKKIRFGVDLTFAPLQFKDSKNNDKPSGYSIDLANMLAKDLGATPEWVEVPFAQLFAAQAAGKFDMAGIAATNLPSRAEKVLFSSEPAFVESQVVLLKPGLSISKVEDLNKSGITIAVLLGSSQEAVAPDLFPKAKFKSLDNQAAIQDVATGRSDATLLSEFNVQEALKKYPKLGVLRGTPIFVDINTFFMPAGDVEMAAYVDNWLRYQMAHGVLASLWNKYVGDFAVSQGLPTVPVRSPYLTGSR